MNAAVPLLQPFAFERALASLEGGIAVSDATQPGHPLVFVNAAFERLTGYASQAVLGRNCRFLQGAETDVDSVRRIRLALAAGEPLRLTLLNYRQDGQPFWNDLALSPIRDADGRLTHVVGLLNDVTAQREAQAAVEAGRLKLQMAIQAAGLVMAEIDYRTNQNHLSGELARLFELGDGPMVVSRQTIFERIHPEDRDRYLQAIARTVDPAGSGHLSIDVRALLPSGTVRWMHIVLQVTFSMLDGELKPDRGICAARDITAETLAQRELLAAQQLVESVIEGAGALVYVKDLEGRYILSNQAWRSLHKLTPERADGIRTEDLFSLEDAARLRANDERVMRDGEAVLMEERAMIDGRPVTYRSSKFPLYDESGKVFAVCGVSTDITDVVEADRRKDEFIATLAHELRNPLAPIRTGLEILRRTGELPPAAARTRDMMERQLTHLVRLVDDLLDVSRITRDKLQIRPERLAVDKVVQHALETSQPVLNAARHEVGVDVAPGLPDIEGDLTRLAQVVSNLLNNAAKYTAQGGRIALSARAEGDDVVIAVTDNGVGIAPEMLPRVFDLFAQVDRTVQRSQGGLGIGLWLVKKLVEMHGGTVAAHSAGPGTGSRFEVRLPAAG